MPNPFVTDSPLPPEELIDREEESRRLLELAEGGHASRLSAPRRYGKTTLLRKVASEAEAVGMTTVYVDFFGVVSLAEVALRIEEAYERNLKGPLARWYAGFRRRWRPKVGLRAPATQLAVEAQPEEDAQRTLHELLDLPLTILERTGKRTLVVFDEFQDVLAADDRIDGLIRSRIQHHGEAASYIFAGSHPGLMAELFGTRDRPLFDQARPIELTPLEDVPLADYIGSRFEATGRDVGAAMTPLLELVRGHPQRAMLMAHHLWETTPPRGRADEDIWQDALQAAFLELQEAFERSWEGLTTNQRRVLAAVAWTGPWGSGQSLYAAETLARFKLAKATARDVRRALVQRGDLERREGDGVRIVDPLFEAWIASGRRTLY